MLRQRQVTLVTTLVVEGAEGTGVREVPALAGATPGIRLYRAMLWLVVPATWRVGLTLALEGTRWTIEAIGTATPQAVSAVWVETVIAQRRSTRGVAVQAGMAQAEGVRFLTVQAPLGRIPRVAATPPGRRTPVTADLVEAWRERYACGGLTQIRLAALAGISEAAMHALLVGQTWRQAGGPLATPRLRGRPPAVAVGGLHLGEASG